MMARQTHLSVTAVPTSGLAAALDSAGCSRRTITYQESAVIYAQGDPANHVFYLQHGTVTLTVLSPTGKEAVVAILWPGDFFGERCLVGTRQRTATASALSTSRVLAIEKTQMLRLLRTRQTVSDQLIACMLRRNIQTEEGLVDQLFDSSETRLARCLVRLAHQHPGTVPLDVPHVSQEILADMVGTTRSRVNFFLNKFRSLGFIDYDGYDFTGRITLNPSLWTVLLHD